MNFKETMEAIALLDPLQAILLMANHGLGKSDCVRAAANFMFIPCVDRRLSQDDVGDLKGMPYMVRGRTYFAPPDWFPLTIEDAKELSEFTGQKVLPANPSGGILFLDEFNRATRDVQQAAFEIILDHRLNQRKMPDNWKVVAAINEDADMYLVNEMCAATVDRFFIINFRPDTEEWFDWAKIAGIHPAVYQFLRKQTDFLDPTEAVIKNSTVKGVNKIHGRRSWHHFSRSLLRYEVAKEKGLTKTEILAKDAASLDTLHTLAMGHVGTLAATSFQNFIATDYQSLDADVILNKFDDSIALRLKTVVEAQRIPELAAYNVMITDYVKNKKIKKFSEKQSSNLLRYIEICPNETVADFWKKFNGEFRELSTDWYKNCGATEKVKARIVNVFMAPDLKNK